jgi:hypothetical protein
VSIELELEDDGTIRVRVDSPGERAVSDTIDPYELITNICTEADITNAVNNGELHILLPLDLSVPVEGEPQVGVDPPEEGESAQEDDNV